MLIDQWRTDSSVDSPAGPLYLGGDYVESDIVGFHGRHDHVCLHAGHARSRQLLQLTMRWIG